MSTAQDWRRTAGAYGKDTHLRGDPCKRRGGSGIAAERASADSARKAEREVALDLPKADGERNVPPAADRMPAEKTGNLADDHAHLQHTALLKRLWKTWQVAVQIPKLRQDSKSLPPPYAVISS